MRKTTAFKDWQPRCTASARASVLIARFSGRPGCVMRLHCLPLQRKDGQTFGARIAAEKRDEEREALKFWSESGAEAKKGFFTVTVQVRTLLCAVQNRERLWYPVQPSFRTFPHARLSSSGGRRESSGTHAPCRRARAGAVGQGAGAGQHPGGSAERWLDRRSRRAQLRTPTPCIPPGCTACCAASHAPPGCHALTQATMM